MFFTTTSVHNYKRSGIARPFIIMHNYNVTSHEAAGGHTNQTYPTDNFEMPQV